MSFSQCTNGLQIVHILHFVVLFSCTNCRYGVLLTYDYLMLHVHSYNIKFEVYWKNRNHLRLLTSYMVYYIKVWRIHALAQYKMSDFFYAFSDKFIQKIVLYRLTFIFTFDRLECHFSRSHTLLKLCWPKGQIITIWNKWLHLKGDEMCVINKICLWSEVIYQIDLPWLWMS